MKLVHCSSVGGDTERVGDNEILSTACDRRDPVGIEHSTRGGIHIPAAQFREGSHARFL
jgi:hypothetical protein